MIAKTVCVYKIESMLMPHEIYVGGTSWFQHRKWRHINQLKLKIHRNINLQNHVNKYGIEDLVFSVLELIEHKENLISREQYWMDKINPSFNILPTAGSCLGRVHLEETKRKIGLGSKGKIISEEQKAIQRAVMIGKKWTDEQRAKFIASRKGVKRPPFTEEWLRNLSIAHKGKDSNTKGWITRRQNMLNKKVA